MEATLLSKSLNDYLQKLNKLQIVPFPDIRQYAKKHNIPIIQLLTVNLLKILVSISNPKRVLEIGTAIGYSSLVMAGEMLDGKITTIELSEPNCEIAKKNFKKYSKQLKKNKVQINLIPGQALKELKTLSGKFDLIFIDARKDQYLEYYKLIKPHLKKGTMLIADNCLWKSQIHQPTTSTKLRNKILKQFNDLLFSDKNCLTTLLPMDDGILISVMK